MKRPRLYRIGLENVYFNFWVFWRWFIYATWQGILMVLILFITMTKNSPNNIGKMMNMQGAGALVLTNIVFVVNMKLLISSFEITLVLLFLVLASIAVYILCLWFTTIYSKETLDYGIFYELMTFGETYVTMIFFLFSYVLVDAGMRYASLEINAIYMRRKQLQEY